MSKHTPGPWKVSETERACWSVRRVGGPAKQTKDLATGVCMINARNVPRETQKYNAKLIAAAPDLLNLAKQMLERLEDERMAALWESPEEHAIEMEIYRSIIAKAEGE